MFRKHARTLFVRDVEGQQKIYRNNLDDERQNSAVNVTVEPAQYNENEANAYIAHRLPGIFGCNYRVLSEVSSLSSKRKIAIAKLTHGPQLKARYPNYRPVSVLDFGSGPGTALWAIRELWPQSSDRIVAIEPSDGMTAINQKLLYGNVATMIDQYRLSTVDYECQSLLRHLLLTYLKQICRLNDENICIWPDHFNTR
jgi:ribosomal protein RSM22 (predicted rRNA methylase)